MLDPSPILIGSSRYPIRGAPAVAFDGSTFLVVWQTQLQGQYIAWDAMGRTVSALRTVYVDDRVAPVLMLKGAARMTHTCGSNWMVTTTGDVNGWAAGTYTVQYHVTDSSGNTALPITRTVDVVNCSW